MEWREAVAEAKRLASEPGIPDHIRLRARFLLDQLAGSLADLTALRDATEWAMDDEEAAGD